MGDDILGGSKVMETQSQQPIPNTARRSLVNELIVRICVSVVTVISLSLIGSDNGFNNIPAFNYLLASVILAFLYSITQSVILGYHLAPCGSNFMQMPFYRYFTSTADLVISLLLLSGSSAAFAITTGANTANTFFAQANGSASLALFSFFIMLPMVAFSFQRILSPY
ncbi:hypothetical protein KP509_23G004400 [Ceratopteris richardii]|uniref:CASP-like protein n=1 Tax=Ceratopteris richardii TaxID=49495 RepID=A0A8T2RWS4_CERRI|nr:hypothetical protein KP509_23G004400 [Ceratopteris richardii]KAH7300937.1 hypothetical protein KP509_23G004400 [Ceratopteris richardii]